MSFGHWAFSVLLIENNYYSFFANFELAIGITLLVSYNKLINKKNYNLKLLLLAVSALNLTFIKRELLI